MTRCAKWLMIAGAVSVGLGAAPQGSSGQVEPPAPGEPKDFALPDKTELTLPNGLGITLVPYGRVPKVAVRLVIRAGNIDEAADEVWMADLMGDLMEEGTTSRSAEQIAQEAARMGGSVNVSVGLDQTSVSGEVLSEFGPDLVALIADVALNPAFPASELDRLKGDRVRQLAMDKSEPSSMVFEAFRAALYPDHPYGRVFPTEEMLAGYSLSDLAAFHEENFAAGRSHVYVSGRFDADAMRTAIESGFGAWETGAEPTLLVPDPIAQRALHAIDRPDAAQSTIYLGLPVVDPSHEDYVPLQVVNALLGGAGFLARITKNIREDKGYTYSPFSQISSRYRDAYWIQVADVTTGVTGAALDEIFAEIDRLRDEPPPADELRKIQNFMGGIFVLQNSSRAGIIFQLSFLELHGLPDSYLRGWIQRVNEVTPEEVQRVAREYIRPESMLLVIAGDRARIESQIGHLGTPVWIGDGG